MLLESENQMISISSYNEPNSQEFSILIILQHFVADEVALDYFVFVDEFDVVVVDFVDDFVAFYRTCFRPEKKKLDILEHYALSKHIFMEKKSNIHTA